MDSYNSENTTHPDCQLDVMSNDLPEFTIGNPHYEDMDELPFCPPDYSPNNELEKVYSEYAVFCMRSVHNLQEPHILRGNHFSSGCILRLTEANLRELEVFIERIDLLELEKIGRSIASRNDRREF